MEPIRTIRSEKEEAVQLSGEFVLHTVRRFWPLAVLAGFILWGWQKQNLLYSVPNYGDTLEFTWVLSWYGEALRSGQGITVYPLAFYPAGWYYAQNLLMLLAMVPLVWLGGAVFAYNVVVLLTFVGGFVGAYRLARLFLDRFDATIAATLITFWGLRWFQTIGHPNILIGAALVPWVLLAIERARQSPGHRTRALAAAGVLWAAAMSGSLYFAFIVGAAVAAWMAGHWLARRVTVRAALVALLVPGAIALSLSLPAIYWIWQSSAQTGVTFYSLNEANFWSASLNSLPLPSLDHPWLGGLARQAYRGLAFEQGFVNFGLLAVLLALMGTWAARRQRAWWPVLVLTGVGVVLTLGVTLKWDDASVQWVAMRPVNSLLWQVGHWLKPDAFTSSTPAAPLDAAIPLPGTLLAMLLPFAERARVFARYALAGGVGVFLLTGLGMSRVPWPWLRGALALLLLLEVLPAPLTRYPFPPEPHPAYVWLASQSMPGQSIADIAAAHPYTPVLLNEGQSVWATRDHRQPTLAGASSTWPAHTMWLFQWLATHPHAFQDADLVPILRFYDVRYVFLHLRSDLEQGLLDEAQQNPALELVNCFPAPATTTPWPYPICVLEVLPAAHPNVNLVLENGWSGQEDWGVWAEGTTAEAMWVAPEQRNYQLSIEAFPLCRPDQKQTLEAQVNGVALGNQAWTGCDPWSTRLDIPADLVQVGANEVVLRMAYAAPPADAQSTDTRQLSVGFSQLRIE